MRVLAYDLYKNTQAAREMGFDYVSLDALYRESDVISLHCPLNQETFHMINHKAITQMKKGVMIINTGGRGDHHLG